MDINFPTLHMTKQREDKDASDQTDKRWWGLNRKQNYHPQNPCSEDDNEK